MEKWMLWGLALIVILVIGWLGYANRDRGDSLRRNPRRRLTEAELKKATEGLQGGQVRKPASREVLAQALANPRGKLEQ